VHEYDDDASARRAAGMSWHICVVAVAENLVTVYYTRAAVVVDLRGRRGALCQGGILTGTYVLQCKHLNCYKFYVSNNEKPPTSTVMRQNLI